MIEKLSNIPAELRNLNQWVAWRAEARNGKTTKVPVSPNTLRLASSTDPGTWGTFAAAADCVAQGQASGVGFVFSAEDPYCGIDLDDCIDTATGEIDTDALATLKRFDTYAELSPSGSGIHVILKGRPPEGVGRKRGDRECYDRGRFFTMTGERVSDTDDVAERQYTLEEWHAETFPAATADRLAPSPLKPLEISDTDIVAKIEASEQGDKFKRLWRGDDSDYGSRSEADLALCSILAWWAKDAAAVDRLFQASGLMREKWEAKRGDSTYGAKTVARAISTTDGGYDPLHKSAAVSIGANPFEGGQGVPPDDGVPPDVDFATNADLKVLDLNTRWVWDLWLQSSVVNLLAAEGGLGKTRMMADLCRRVHLGLPWPDGTPSTPYAGQYLGMWVAGDRNHGELLGLSEAFGFGDRICYSGSKKDPLGGISLQTADDFKSLYRRVKAARPLFLVIDTAGGSTGYNLSKQEDARAFFAPLSDMAARLALCVVVITHLNAAKNVLGKRAEERVRCVVRMSAENRKPETKRRVEVVKSNGLFPDPLGMTLREIGSDWDNEPPAPPDDGTGADNSNLERGPATKVRECMDWLREALTLQPAKVSLLRDEGQRRGFSVPTIYAAKAKLGLMETELQSFKYWALKDYDRTF